MTIGKVVGTVVCTQKDPSLVGKKILVVQPLRLEDLANNGNTFVALDSAGAGMGELVMVVAGSSARMAGEFSKVCVDQSIIAILDCIEIGGTSVYDKAHTELPA